MNQSKLIITQNKILDDFNKSLRELKEEFHKTGRYDDANVKLDEILKLLTIEFFDIQNNTKLLNIEHLKKIANKKYGNRENIAKALQYLFSQIAKNKMFFNKDGTNIFGKNPQLNISDVDNNFAEKIVSIIDKIHPNKIKGKTTAFDVLNESFGHFVRDSFRNHKEDAQYMTPSEVANAMIDMALHDILNDPISKKNIFSKNTDDFYVLDPTCGVGTFLINVSNKISEKISSSSIKNKDKILKIRNNYSYIGQDKVDRMVRMSKINFLFYGLNPNNISQGNSIVGSSFIDNYKESVDLIITNPPFGAEFNFNELLNKNGKFEILHRVKNSAKAKTINSEIIMLDRSLKLLKPGGRLLIIVPDGVVSALGLFETYRKLLSENYILKAVIDLPAVTFAQAGTRTKCSILYIQKPYKKENLIQNGIFMAVADDIGYEVKERMGSPVKFYKGENELIKISNEYKKLADTKKTQIISEKPSIVIYPFDLIINGKWNANFYRAGRIKALDSIDKVNLKEFEIKSLREIAESFNKQRKKISVSDGTKCISVLHIKEDSTVNLHEVEKYKPICAGIECFPGEILFSKINPRIPRVIVVPKTEHNLTCSSEFEILKPFNSDSTFLLKTMLLTDAVQKQILSLTSGTSSSHNRIKDAELLNIKIPWPKKGSKAEAKLLSLSEGIKKAEKQIYLTNEKLKQHFDELEKSVGL